MNVEGIQEVFRDKNPAGSYALDLENNEGVKSVGLLEIKPNGDSFAEISIRASDFRPSDQNFDWFGTTNRGRKISLLGGHHVDSSVAFGSCTFLQKFDTAFLGARVKSVDEELFSTIMVPMESMVTFSRKLRDISEEMKSSSHYDDLSKYYTDCDFILKDGTKVSLVNSVSFSDSFLSRSKVVTSYFLFETEKPVSHRYIVDNYLDPLICFMSLLCFEKVKVTKLRYGTLEPNFNENIEVILSGSLDEHRSIIPSVMFEDISIESLKLFMDDFHTVSKQCKKLVSIFSNSLKSVILDLTIEVEKMYKSSKLHGAKDYKSKLSALYHSSSHLMSGIITDKKLWMDRVKAHRTYLVHDSQELEIYGNTYNEMRALSQSLMWLFVFEVFSRVGIKSREMSAFKKSFGYNDLKGKLESFLGSGSVPNDFTDKGHPIEYSI